MGPSINEQSNLKFTLTMRHSAGSIKKYYGWRYQVISVKFDRIQPFSLELESVKKLYDDGIYHNHISWKDVRKRHIMKTCGDQVRKIKWNVQLSNVSFRRSVSPKKIKNISSNIQMIPLKWNNPSGTPNKLIQFKKVLDNILLSCHCLVYGYLTDI